ncbi:hypothetical protein UVI_02025780 [Ustilaginoidea virens]|uniref:RING-type E3 ubiquitin transferase n=1 Tax=Ustilaginoidea virens TaxID=1159556 RepID=A0A1B5KS15_USTVR|nr:hypothetical protein UVI_02025780 [Ustilaginoidea virens]
MRVGCSFVYGLTKLCYGTLRAVEVEQLTERAWFAITETCLAMTIFREEIGAWFLVMFTTLVTGKVWGWIGDGRVEFLEQQPPANPRLFHLRLSVSLALSFIYDVWILKYTIDTVIRQARPNMMVMFLFEFAVLATCSWRTAARYVLSITEQSIVSVQTRQRLAERRLELSRRREAMVRARDQAAASGHEHNSHQEPIPDEEEDIDEMDIEVPGWAAKGEWVLWLDLVTGKSLLPVPIPDSSNEPFSLLDMIKLGIYVAFFCMLLRFYGLPIHIMRDLFMTSRDFIKRLNALLRYRRAIREMSKYPDATVVELSQENTCIICREEMRLWDPANQPSAINRARPKKLPCGHVLHLGCLKSWLERQQVCPTCRSPVAINRAGSGVNRPAGQRFQLDNVAQVPDRHQQPAFNNNGLNGGQPLNNNNNNNGQPAPPRGGGARVFNIGPLRLAFGANAQQAREIVQRIGGGQDERNQTQGPTSTPNQNQPQAGDNVQQIGNLLAQTENLIRREVESLQASQQEVQVAHLLMTELQRLRQRRPQQDPSLRSQPAVLPMVNGMVNITLPPAQHFHHLAQGHTHTALASPGHGIPSFGSPFVVRHGPVPNGSAIPAGSPELPHGVTLPPGWSLIPLQRLNGSQTQQPQPQQSMHPAETSASGELDNPQHAAMDFEPTSVNAMPEDDDRIAGTNVSGDGAVRSILENVATNVSNTTGVAPTATPMAAPRPIPPNYEVPSQLLAHQSQHDVPESHVRSSDHLEPTEEQQKSEQLATAGSGSGGGDLVSGDAAQASNELSQDVGGKGKGRAATVEDSYEEDEN